MLSTAMFSIVTFLILYTIGLSLLALFNAFWHQTCLPSSCMSFVTGCISIFKSLSYLLPFFSWHNRATTEFNPCRWLQRCCFVVIKIIKFMWKHKCIQNDFTGLAFTAVWHSLNLLYINSCFCSSMHTCRLML